MGRHVAPRTRTRDDKDAGSVDAPAARRKREYEDDAFAKACGRMLAAMERRASSNPDALAYMLTLKGEMDAAITRAGHALTPAGGGLFSLAELAQFMTYNGHGMSRQAAQQRWGAKAVAAKVGATVTEKINNVVRLADFRTRRASEKGNGADGAATRTA